MGLSKMAPECRKCLFKDECKNKRMVGYLEAELSKPNGEVLSNYNVIKYIPLTINLGNGEKIQTSLEDMYKWMRKNFTKIQG